MAMTLHMICNSHIDPVWQWHWDEGAATALGTFRTVADMCEEFDMFVFNHNEAVLYKWVEEYEPALFARIQALVKAGKWHIMGGWYVQPDCNMPHGESLVRQILVGKRYFQETFGVRPTTAINFDSFGHARGLVQILAKSGYDSYLHWRPTREASGQDGDEYIWVGQDGSEILVTRAEEGYGSPLGEAGQRLERHLQKFADHPNAVMLWGVGNHGGGPSRKDIRDLNRIIKTQTECAVLHSTPEAYFAAQKKRRAELPRWERDINHFGVGCYTSMARIKQTYRALENEFYLTEKMSSAAAAHGVAAYPAEALRDVQETLLFSAFHDFLPGTSTPPVEESSLRFMEHGRETLMRLRTCAFFALAASQPKAKPDTYPVLVYNPHPWPVETTVVADMNLPDVVFCDKTYFVPTLRQKGKEIPIQPERPDSNYAIDWRKRVVFRARLEPSQMNRFDVKLVETKLRPVLPALEKNGVIRVRGDEVDWAINTHTGRIQHLRIGGKDYVKPDAFAAVVMQGSPDPWSMNEDVFDNQLGAFKLLSQTESAGLAGISAKRLKAVHLVEDGPVRTVVEAMFGYGQSSLVMTWSIPKRGRDVELQVRVFWNEKDKVLKLAIPTRGKKSRYLGQVVYGRDELADSGRDVVAQKWTAVVSEEDDMAFSCINAGTYGSSFHDGEVRLSLLRSSAYTALPIGDWPMMPADVFRPRIDQGERVFRFQFTGSAARERLAAVDREAQVFNETPVTLWFSPPGEGAPQKSFVRLSNPAVQMTSLKQAEDGKGWIVRLFEPTGKKQTTRLDVSGRKPIRATITLAPFEIRTVRVNPEKGTLAVVDLLEETTKC